MHILTLETDPEPVRVRRSRQDRQRMIPLFPSPGPSVTALNVGLLVVLGLAPLVPLVRQALRAGRQRRRLAGRFHARAQAQGLTPAQSRLLWQLARQGGVKDPRVLLQAPAAFERCVSRGVARLNGQTAPELGRIRTVLGFDRLVPHQWVRTSRQLERGQRLVIASENGTPAASEWVVGARDEQALVASPLLEHPDCTWSAWLPGERVQVRFQRGNDATYGFATDVLAVEPQAQRLVLRHADRVERRQRRGFFRWDAPFAIVLFVPVQEGPLDREQAVRLEGTVVNISGGGLCVQLPEDVPPAARVVVDPGFRGPFPLAGVRCQVVSGNGAGPGGALRLRFVELSAEEEAGMVRAIHQRQLGLKPAKRPAPTSVRSRVRKKRAGRRRSRAMPE